MKTNYKLKGAIDELTSINTTYKIGDKEKFNKVLEIDDKDKKLNYENLKKKKG